MLDPSLFKLLKSGLVIPAHPLALTDDGKFDERRQRAITRYYCDAGAGGLAVAVHTTQFAIRDPKIGLFKPVLHLASETVEEYAGRPMVKIGGVCGPTKQAVAEAAVLKETGYDIALVSLAALRDETVAELIMHCREVAQVLPIMGFYLQPAVGGRLLPLEFWRELASIENLVGIKFAPFNRYQTLDVIRGVAESGRAGQVALYTGNDDNIIIDLLTDFRVNLNGKRIHLRVVGGLLGHWACWTRQAVHVLQACHRCLDRGGDVPGELLTRAAEVTDANAAFFDATNGFRGCIAGIHEVLRRQGLMANRRCLDSHEELSPGQMEEIDRVYAAYPHLNDDAFVLQHLDAWLN